MMDGSDAVVRLAAVSRRFGDVTAVDGVDLAVPAGSLTALLGPSGCGKTTTLRMIAGYERPTAGQIFIDGRDATTLAPEKRNIGMVFQSYALFPHLTVAKNVGFGLKVRGVAREEIRTRVHAALELVGLSDLSGRRPRELSGGQQQRVALARAIAIRPSVLLLDEPLSNLDARLRVQMRAELARIQRESGITTILVTHDQEEALQLADQMVILDSGRVAQAGHPREIFPAPASRFVATFLGYENFLTLPGRGLVTIRPEHVEVLPESDPDPDGGQSRPGTISHITYRGTDSLVTLDVAGETVLAAVKDSDLREGTRVRAVFPDDHVVSLPS
ncbi:ABC transporter ATP-binding protein [Planotetraspora thailandica]|nr:ABC transporter ATP-binding protein [Planotetraspora thailandica]